MPIQIQHKRGIAAHLPSLLAGEVYYATDTNLLYVNNGTSTVLLGSPAIAQFTVAGLPGSPVEGQLAYATNGRKVGEGAGAGTGVPVYFSNTKWRVYSTDAQVTS